MLKVASTRENSELHIRALQSSQIWMSSVTLQIDTSKFENCSFFSSSHGVSIGVNHTINLKIKKFDIFISTSEHMYKKHRSPEIVLASLFTWLLINMNSPLLNVSLCQISWFPPIQNNWNKIGPLTSRLFGPARNHGKTFSKLRQTTFSRILR